MSDTFTADEIEHCKAAMAKPAPLQALAAIASGHCLIELTPDRRDVRITVWDGRALEMPGFLAGAWPLYRAGMIDQYGCVTAAGRAALEQGA